MRDYVRGLLGPVGCKSGWQLAEYAGHTTPDGLQQLFAGARWDADEIRDELQYYVAERLGEDGGVLILDDTGGVIRSDVGGAANTGPAGTFVSLLIADDDEVTRIGLRTLLAAQPGIAVVGEAADGVEAVEQAVRLRPDVVLMDMQMPRRNGIEATRQLLAGSAEPPKVVVIATFENDGYFTAPLSAGASGFVLKRRPTRADRRGGMGGGGRGGDPLPGRPAPDGHRPPAGLRRGVAEGGAGPAGADALLFRSRSPC